MLIIEASIYLEDIGFFGICAGHLSNTLVRTILVFNGCLNAIFCQYSMAYSTFIYKLS